MLNRLVALLPRSAHWSRPGRPLPPHPRQPQLFRRQRVRTGPGTWRARPRVAVLERVRKLGAADGEHERRRRLLGVLGRTRRSRTVAVSVARAGRHPGRRDRWPDRLLRVVRAASVRAGQAQPRDPSGRPHRGQGFGQRKQRHVLAVGPDDRAVLHQDASDEQPGYLQRRVDRRGAVGLRRSGQLPAATAGRLRHGQLHERDRHRGGHTGAISDPSWTAQAVQLAGSATPPPSRRRCRAMAPRSRSAGSRPAARAASRPGATGTAAATATAVAMATAVAATATAVAATAPTAPRLRHGGYGGYGARNGRYGGYAAMPATTERQQ